MSLAFSIKFINYTVYNANPEDPQIVEYYQARFQSEFIFRDAKQFTGLSDCQARHLPRLDFHFNASLIALNLAKYEVSSCHSSAKTFVFSMASYKRLEFNNTNSL